MVVPYFRLVAQFWIEVHEWLQSCVSDEASRESRCRVEEERRKTERDLRSECLERCFPKPVNIVHHE
jgi:hypothetical protein